MGADLLGFKVVRSVLVFIPVLGPVFYLFTGNPPANMAPHLRDKPSDTDYVDLGWRANFTEKWQREKPVLESKIKELQQALDSQESAKK